VRDSPSNNNVGINSVHAVILHRHGLAVLAPDAAEAVGDFADGGERFDALKYVWEKVVGGACGVFEEGEGDLCFFRVAALTEGVEAFDL
jgi:hypothetical protein